MFKTKKIFYLLIVYLLIVKLQIAQNAINYIKVIDEYPTPTQLEDFFHQRIKYDKNGKIHVLSYDGKRFFISDNANGKFSSFKPIANGSVNISNLAGYALAHHYDFEIDDNQKVHIAFATYVFGQNILDSDRVYMFYTNSELQGAIYLGYSSLPISGVYSPYYFKVNVLKTNNNGIICNYLHYYPNSNKINWKQAIIDNQLNLTLKYLKIQLPLTSFNSYSSLLLPYANKYLFVNLIYASEDYLYPYDTLKVQRYFIKYDIDGQSELIETAVVISELGAVNAPYYCADGAEGYVHVSNFNIRLLENGIINTSTPLDKSIFALDRNNNLHALKIGPTDFEYYLYENLPVLEGSSFSLKHTINRDYFPEILSPPNSDNYLKSGSISAFSKNDAAIFFNFSEYLVRQKNQSFEYKLFPSKLFESSSLNRNNYWNFIQKNGKKYLLNPLNYTVENDSVGFVYLYEIQETDNGFFVDYDLGNFLKIKLPGYLGLRPTYSNRIPLLAKKDKNDNLHFLIFKIVNYNNLTQRDLGQWVYYRLSPNFELTGGEVAHPDTLHLTSPFIDFDIDENNTVHFVYAKDAKIYYANNSQGQFFDPVFTGGYISNSGTNWISVKAASNGKAYIVYLNGINGVYFIFYDSQNFSLPKKLFVSENYLSSGASTVAFEIDRLNYLNFFEIALINNVKKLIWKYKALSDSAIIYPAGVGYFSNLQGPVYVNSLKNFQNNVLLIGVAENKQIYTLSSVDNYQQLRLYSLDDFSLSSYQNQNDPFYWWIFKPIAAENDYLYFIASDYKKFLLGRLETSSWNNVKKDIVSANDFNVSQNYPNPFNSQTKILVKLNKNSAVKLTVYDALGKELFKIYEKSLSAGIHTLNLEMSEFPSGVYYYKLETEFSSETKKLILLK